MKSVLPFLVLMSVVIVSVSTEFEENKQPLKHIIEELQREDRLVNGSLLEIAHKEGARKFVSLVYRAGLADLLKLQTIGDFTLFLPTDKAFGKLPFWVYPYLLVNGRAARAIVLFHLTRGAVSSTDLHNEQLLPSLHDRSDLRINIYHEYNDSILVVSGAKVVKADINATNGVVHTLDRVVLSIPNTPMAYVVTKCPIFNTLWKAILLTNLTSTICENPLTLFAPSDRAFSKLPEGLLKNLTKDPAKLKVVLEYHMVRSSVYSAGLVDGENITTVEGGSLNITVSDSGIKVNDARLVFADGNVRNGVLHVIDRVLVPEVMMDDWQKFFESEKTAENNKIPNSDWHGNSINAFRYAFNQLSNSRNPEKL